MFFKKKKEETFDDDDFLDDDDFSFDDEGGFDSDTEMGSRNPISLISGDFVSGMKESAKSASTHKRILRNSLPKGYTHAYEAGEDIRSEMRDGYSAIKDEASKQVNEFKKQNQRVIKKMGALVPGRAGKKIQDWGARVDSSDFSTPDFESLGVAAQLGDIFGAQASVEAQERATETAIAGVTEARQQTQIALSSQDALVGINNSMTRVVEYQDGINSKYQRKMIELTFRHLFVARKGLDIQEQQAGLLKTSLDAITTNTSLPDVLKVRNTELASSIAKQKYLGEVTEGVSSSLSSYTAKIGKRLTEKAVKTVASAGSIFGGATSELGGIIMGDESGMGGVSLKELISMELAGLASAKATDQIIKGSSGWLKNQAGGKNKENIDKGNTIIEIMRQSGGRYANEHLMKGTTGNSIVDAISRWGGLSEDSVGHKTKVAGSYVDHMSEGSVFDNQTHRSINEIIPELLSRIHFETQRFNGDEPSSRLTYDWRMNKFSTADEIDGRLLDEIQSKNNVDTLNKTQRDILANLDPHSELSDDARAAVAKLTAVASMTGQDVRLMALIDPGSKQYNKEIADHVAERLGTRMEYGDGSKNPLEFYKGASQEFLNAEYSFQKGINEGKYGIKDPLNDLLDHAKQGRVSDLGEIEFMEHGPNGDLRVNPEKYYDFVMKRSEQDKAKAGNVKPGGLGDDWIKRYSPSDSPDPTGGSGGAAASPYGPGSALATWLKRAGVAGAGLGAAGFAQAATVGGDLAMNGLTMADGSTMSLVLGGTLAGTAIAGKFFGSNESDTESRFQNRANFSSDSDPTVAMLERIHESMNKRDYSEGIGAIGQQVTLLSDTVGVIAANMGSGGRVDVDILNTLGAGQRSVLGAYNLTKSTVTKGFNAIGPLIKGYYKGVGKGVMGAGRGAMGVFKWGKNTVGEQLNSGINAIYVKGQAVASLTPSGIKEQQYVDANTGNIIKKLSDITGAVTNQDGSITFITQEQFETDGVEDRPASAFGLAKTAAGGVFGLMTKPYAAMGKVAMGAFNLLDGHTFKSGIFLQGEDSPRLDILSLKRGYYRLAENGKVVKSLRDIKGDIVDRAGNVVLTMDQIKEGLFDKEGKKIELDLSRISMGLGKGFDAAWKVGGKLAGMAVDVVGTVGRWGLDMFSGAKQKLAKWREDKDYNSLFSFGVFSSSAKQLEEVKAIRKLMESKWGDKSHYSDGDGDGDRDGSYKDIKQGKAENEKKSLTDRFMDMFNSKKSGDKEEKKQGFFGSIIGGIGGILNDVMGSVLKVALPTIIGTMGLKGIAKYLLNKNQEVIAEDDPRLDPSSPQYDPDLKAGPQEAGMGGKAAAWFLEQNGWAQAGMGLAAAKGAMMLPGLAGKAVWGAGKLLKKGVNAMGAANAARGGAGGLLGAASTLGRSAGALGRGALFVGKFALRFAGPIGWAWTAYTVIKWGMKKLDEMSLGDGALIRLRMAAYGYDANNKDKTAFFLGLENTLLPYTKMDKGEAYVTNDISVEDVMSVFGINPGDGDAAQEWEEYFHKRFLPVYLTFATIMHNQANTVDVASMDTKLDPEQKLALCDQSIFGREENNPYDIMTSGFPNEGSVDSNREDVLKVYKIARVALESSHAKTKGTYISKQSAIDEATVTEREKQVAKMNEESAKKNKKLSERINEVIKNGATSMFGDRFGELVGGLADGTITPFSLGKQAGEGLKGWFSKLFGDAGTPASGGGGGGGSSPTMSGDPSKSFTPEVAGAVKWGAEQLGIDPNHLASVISFETGGTFSPNARNPGSSGTGLIQFMDAADGKKDKMYWGMSRDKFGSLTVAQQMEYVVRYFKERKLKAGATLGQVYDAVTGTGYRAGSESYRLNKVWDANKDGYIAPGESVTSGAFKAHMKDFFGGDKGTTQATAPSTPVQAAAAASTAKGATKTKTPVKPGTGPLKPTATSTKAATASAAKKTTAKTAPKMPGGDGGLIGAGMAKAAASAPASPVKDKAVAGTGTGKFNTDITGSMKAKNAVADKKPTTATEAATGSSAVEPVASNLPQLRLPANSRPAKAAAYIARNARTGSTGRCAYYVRMGLGAGGYSFTSNASAYMYSTRGTMVGMGFTQIASGSQMQIGDVMVFNQNSAHVHGHIQMLTTKGWTSDFVQRTWKVYSTNCPPFQLFRDSQYLNGAKPGSGWAAAVDGNVGSGTTMGVDGGSAENGGTGEFGASAPAKKWVRSGPAIASGKALWKQKDGTGGAATMGAGAKAKDAKVDGTATIKSDAKPGVGGSGVGNAKTPAKASTSKVSGSEFDAITGGDTTAKSAVVDATAVRSEKELENKAAKAAVEKEKKAEQALKARTEQATSKFTDHTDILNRQLDVQKNIHQALTSMGLDIRKLAGNGGLPQPGASIESVQSQINQPGAPRPTIEKLKEPVSLLKG